MKFYNLITQVIVKTHLKSKRNETRQFAAEANWIIVWEDSNSTWRSEGKKSILNSLFFRLYCERLSCLSVCFPSSAFHGLFIYFSPLGFVFSSSFWCPVSFSIFFSNTYFSNFISLLPREQQDLSFKFILNFCLSLFHGALLYYCHMNSSTKSGKITRYFAFQFLGWRKTSNYLFTSLTKR